MEITKDTVQKVAKVARLKLTDEELEKFTPQLNDILDTFSKIDEVDTKDVQMSIQPVAVRNALREDIPKESLPIDLALKNAHHKKDSYFKGPKAI